MLLGTVEVFFSIIFSYLGFEAFQMVPYLRLLNVIFVLLFLIKKRLITKRTITKLDKKNKFNNKLLLYWVFITVISFLIGIIRLNPIVYLITDLVYILIGVLLYRIAQINIDVEDDLDKLENNRNIHNSFLLFLISTSIICSVFKIGLPSFLLVLSVNFALYFFLKKEYSFSFFYLVPFILQIIVSNRAILIVFIIIFILSFFRRPMKKEKLIRIFLYSVVLLLIMPFLLSFSIRQVLPLLSDESTLKPRLAQILMLTEGKYKWDSPEMLSLKQRFDELFLVVDFWIDNVFNFIFGGGLGATINGNSFKDAGVGTSAILGKEKIHNIHILPFSLLFRYGLLGLFLFYFLIKKAFIGLIKNLTTKTSVLNCLILFQVCWIIYSIPAASFLWTCPLFWILLAYENEKN